MTDRFEQITAGQTEEQIAEIDRLLDLGTVWRNGQVVDFHLDWLDAAARMALYKLCQNTGIRIRAHGIGWWPPMQH